MNLILHTRCVSLKKKKKYIYIYIYMCVCVCVFEICVCITVFISSVMFRNALLICKRMLSYF